jgi:class 6 POU domain transcription factor
MQQFLLPSSEGGSSQIINIPLSLLSQGNQQPISFITANGQIFQLPNFSQLVVPQNGESNTATANTTTTSNNGTALNATSSSTASTAATTTTTTPAAGTTNNSNQQQALVINSQGQIISLPVLQPQGQATQQQGQTTQQTQNAQGIQAMNANNLNSFNQNTSNNTNNNQQQQQTNQQQQQTVSLSQINFASLTNNGVQLQTLNSANNRNTSNVANANMNNSNAANNSQVIGNGGTPIKTLLEDDEIKSDNDIENDNGPTIANMPSTNNLTSGLPQTHVTHHATTVDGVNLDEIREFAKAFKLRRLALGLTQTQVGQALSATKGPAYSQSAICRFEKLDITPKSAAKIKPVLEKWMQEAELKYADRLGLKTGNQQNFADLLGSDSTKKRKRRTSFTPQALEILNEAFEKNTHPSGTELSGNQGADMTMLANKLNYDREVIRVWFCNKRQALKNTIKKFKSGTGLDDSGTISPSEQMSPNSSQQQLNTSSQQIQQQLQNQVVHQHVQQQQLQQSPIQNNVQQVQNTVNVVSSISQSLANVVAGTSTLGSSSPKTVITLQCNNTNNTNNTTPPTNTNNTNTTPTPTSTTTTTTNANSSTINNTNTTTNTNTNDSPQNQQNITSTTPPQTQNLVQANTTLKIGNILYTFKMF